MAKQKWEWGPVAIGLYKALLWLTILVGIFIPRSLLWYAPLMLFLGFGLKPALEVSGLGEFLINLKEKWTAARWKNIEKEARRKVKQKQRDEKYRGQRVKDPRLPKNW